MKKLIAWVKNIEWSKIITLLVSISCLVYAFWSGVRYYELVQLAIEQNSMVMPDATLPVTGITSLICSVLGYFTYQSILKTSLNKNGLKVDEMGIVQSILNNDLQSIADYAQQQAEIESIQSKPKKSTKTSTGVKTNKPVQEEKKVSKKYFD